MDTNRIKRFATEARNKQKEGIAAKIRTLGFDKQGNVADEQRSAHLSNYKDGAVCIRYEKVMNGDILKDFLSVSAE